MGGLIPEGYEGEALDAVREALVARRALPKAGKEDLELLIQTPEDGVIVHLRKPVRPDDQFISDGSFVVIRRDGDEIGVVNPRQVSLDTFDTLKKTGDLSPRQAKSLIRGVRFARTNQHTVPQAVSVESVGNFNAWAFHDAQGRRIGSLTLDYAGVGALLIEERNSRGRVTSRGIYDLRAPAGKVGRQAMYELAQLVQGNSLKDSPYLRPEERAKLGDMRAAASLREVLELIEMFGMRSDYHAERASAVDDLREVHQVMSADVKAGKPTVLLGNVRGHEVPLYVETSAKPTYLTPLTPICPSDEEAGLFGKHALTFVGTVRYAVPGVGQRAHHGGFHLILPKSRDTVVLVTAGNRGIASDVAAK